MIPVTRRHQIQVLRAAGHTQPEVAKLSSTSERSVRRIEAEPPIEQLASGDQAKRRGVGRPSKAEPFRTWASTLLEREPTLPTLEVLRRAREDGYRGAKSAFYQLVSSVRPPPPVKPMVRFEGLAGEFSQHDFGEVKVRFIDGRRVKVVFFASRLKYSRYVCVSLCDNQQVEALSRSFVEHLHDFGGVPLLAVFDRPKTVAIAWRKDGTVTQWNSTFLSVVNELRVGVELCWPYSPEQKGSVENLVGWVKKSFFKVRAFVDEDDLRRQLSQWLHEVNTERPSRATNVIPAERLAEERARLRPLRIDPSTMELPVPVQVGLTGRVRWVGQYSMPADAIGLSGTLYLGRDHVRIVAGRFSALHPRLRDPDDKSILPEHRASMVARVSGKRGKNYLKREHILELSAEAVEYMTELVHRRPNLWHDDVHLLHELLDLHGAEAMRAAIATALQAQTYGPRYVAAHLGELDRLERMVFSETSQ
jgi:transposase